MKVDFNVLLESAINKEREERAKRERSGKYSPSRMGRCYRFQYWNRLNEPETNPIDISVFRRFRAGNIYHRDLQSLVKNNEVKYEDNNFVMFADNVGQDYVVDFKTVTSFQFKKMLKMSLKSIAEDKAQYVMQIMTYCYFLKKPFGYLVFVNKDDYMIKQVELKLADYIGLVKDEIDIILGYWERKKIPPAIPRAYGGKECQYCSYLNKCKNLEKEVDCGNTENRG